MDPKPTSHVITIDENIAEVDQRELETYAQLCRLIEQAKQKKRQEVNRQSPSQSGQPPPQSAQPTPEPAQPIPESAQPTPEPAQPTPKPAQPIPKPAQPTPKPAQPIPEPAHPTLKPVQPTPQSGQLTPEPVQPTPGPAQVTSEPAQVTPEPAQLIPEPLQPTPEPAQPIPEPAPVTPEPAQLTPEPVQQTPQPGQPPPQTGQQTRGQPAVNGQQPRELTKEEVAELENLVYSKEKRNRVQSRTLSITTGDILGELAPKTEQIELTKLPHSYKLIRNLLWIEKNPVYKKALAEWEAQENIFASIVGRKLKRSGDFRNEIYNMLGYYSVFQGVLLTASSQSSYLHCLNVGLPIALSAFASVGTLVHISRKLQAINGLERTISREQISLLEVKKRIQALKEKGKEFRFYDFLEDEKIIKSSSQPRFKSFAILLAILLFSLSFILAHPLILCRSGPK